MPNEMLDELSGEISTIEEIDGDIEADGSLDGDVEIPKAYVEKIQKTVIFDDLVRIADEITLSLPSSYNFIVFEVSYMYDGATGSAIYSSLNDNINIPANYSGTSHWMELRMAGDIVSVRGDADVDQGGARLKITVF